jgi:hypothetical protein
MRVRLLEVAAASLSVGVGVRLEGVGPGPGSDLVTTRRRTLRRGLAQAGARPDQLVIDMGVDIALEELIATSGASPCAFTEEDLVAQGALGRRMSRVIPTHVDACRPVSLWFAGVEYGVEVQRLRVVPADAVECPAAPPASAVGDTDAAREVERSAARVREDSERLEMLRAGFARGFTARRQLLAAGWRAARSCSGPGRG